MNFNQLSIDITNRLSKNVKKSEGIFFTPKNIIKKIINFVLTLKPDIEIILEPSCGSGQFVDYLHELGKKNVTAIEKNKTICESVNHFDIICDDFLNYQFSTQFDLIVGNPPYFTVPKNEIDKQYYRYFKGRPNIYILFIIKSFELLKENGVLAFVLPSNFLNCIYYNDLRKHLKNYKINVFFSNEKFLETAQETCIFILQKTKEKKKSEFFIEFGSIVLFQTIENIKQIKKLKENSSTLSSLGCSLNIGTVVWNECKKILTDDSSKTLLIYSSDFKKNILDISCYKDCKKNYINKQGSSDTVLLVNRGYGTGKYILRYCLVEHNNYLVENHCIVIHAEKDTLNLIVKSFENNKTKEFISLVFSNNAINIEEFLHVLPIYLCD